MYQGVDIVDIFDMADFLMNLFRKNLAEKNDDKEPLNLKNALGSPKIHLEIFFDIVGIIDTVDTLEAIWNNARL